MSGLMQTNIFLMHLSASVACRGTNSLQGLITDLLPLQ